MTTEIKEIALPQGTIHYRDSGTGEPLVFVHGFLVNGTLWSELVPHLERDFRCIVPDLPFGSHPEPMHPGADLTPPGAAKLVADFMAALDLEGVTLVGNDTGGAICQLVAAEHPERLARLVLTPCDTYENFPPGMFKYLLGVGKVPGAVTLLVQSTRLKANRRSPIAYGWLTKRRLPDELLDGWVQPALRDKLIRRDIRKLLRGISNRYTLEAAEKLKRFDRPALLAWARDDRLFKLRDAERLAGGMPNARLEVLDDAGTFVSLDQPERLAELIAGFVREPRPEGAAVS